MAYKHPDADSLAEELREQAQQHLPDKRTSVVVLDAGRPVAWVLLSDRVPIAADPDRSRCIGFVRSAAGLRSGCGPTITP